MKYRLVYDVLNEGSLGFWFAGGVVIALFAFAGAIFLEILERLQGRPPAPAPCHPGRLEILPFPVVIVLGLLFVFLAVRFAWFTYEVIAQQARCQEWARTGEYQVAEGTITEYEYRKAGSRFRVGGLPFDLLQRNAGFTGRFNAPGTAQSSLRDGLRVRLAHREGYIVRVEVVSIP